MPSFEEESSSNGSFSSEINSTNTASTFANEFGSPRGVKKSDKRLFLIDIDKNGGIFHVNLATLISSNPGRYGHDGTKEGKSQKRKYQNLLDHWKREAKKDRFESIRRDLLNLPAIPLSVQADTPKKAAKEKSETMSSSGEDKKYSPGGKFLSEF